MADAQGTLCDSWSVLELEPFGFEERVREPWFLRPAGELPADTCAPELEIVHVGTPAEVAEFEDASVRGFGGIIFGEVEANPREVEAGSLHPASGLADAQMTMLTGRVEGAAVTAAMGYRTDTAVGIFGVTTVASARGPAMRRLSLVR